MDKVVLAVFSDSHGETYGIRRAAALLSGQKAERITLAAHLGDGAAEARLLAELFGGAVAVRGNCDFLPALPARRVLELSGARLLLVHGHEYGVKQGVERLIEEAVREGCRAVLFGHTHAPVVARREGVLLINPGSIAQPRGRPPTFAVVMAAGGRVDARIVEA